jgi:hypothetical protein
MITLTVGVDEGAGDGVVVTGHTLGIGVGVAVGVRVAVAVGVPLCAKAAIETMSRPNNSIRQRRALRPVTALRAVRANLFSDIKKNGAPESLELQFGNSNLAKPCGLARKGSNVPCARQARRAVGLRKVL